MPPSGRAASDRIDAAHDVLAQIEVRYWHVGVHSARPGGKSEFASEKWICLLAKGGILPSPCFEKAQLIEPREGYSWANPTTPELRREVMRCILFSAAVIAGAVWGSSVPAMATQLVTSRLISANLETTLDSGGRLASPVPALRLSRTIRLLSSRLWLLRAAAGVRLLSTRLMTPMCLRLPSRMATIHQRMATTATIRPRMASMVSIRPRTPTDRPRDRVGTVLDHKRSPFSPTPSFACVAERCANATEGPRRSRPRSALPHHGWHVRLWH